MEVGAVKQAFNNEVIHLKQKLNQARIQVIHKLTRKAKTLVDKKKAPEKLQEKLKRKAESAVKEVLILKKIKPRDIAKFTVTHTGELQTYLNRPNVDMDKACARLLLHKALQDKYKHIRKMYSNVPIEDLLMSRLERRKLKKEEKEKQMNKMNEKQSRKKNNSISSEGDWTVEDIKNAAAKIGQTKSEDVSSDGSNDSEKDDESANVSDGEKEVMDDDNDESEPVAHVDEAEDESEEQPDENEDDDNEKDDKSESENENEDPKDSDEEVKQESKDESDKESNDIEMEAKEDEKPKEKVLEKSKSKPKPNQNKKKLNKKPVKEDNRAKLPKINKDKNKKQLEKIATKKFKKGLEDDNLPDSNQVVDPFFITASGDNYISVAERRAPDEVKEIHTHGNRKHRRAAMFGNEVISRPRPNNNNRNGFNDSNDEYSSMNRFGKGNFDRRIQRNDFDRRNDTNNYDQRNNRNGFDRRNDRNFDRRDNQNNYNRSNNFDKQNNSSNFDNNNKFNSFGGKPDFNTNKFNKSNDFGNGEEKKSVPEKLHPSWEAKKKISSIVPFQGTKIKFDEG